MAAEVVDTPAIEGQPIKKKRGRKPKDVKVEVINKKIVNIIDSLNIIQTNPINSEDAKPNDEPGATNEIISVETADTPPKKGRRGRKPKYVYSSYSLTPQEDTANIASMSDDENVIVRLNINDVDNETTDDILKHEEHPYAYNHDTYKLISNVSDIHNDAPLDVTSIVPHTCNGGVKVVNILQDFEEKNKNNEWPLNTSISCYWCCHRFDNSPFGIPINYIRNKFEVFGCFCSLECAAAYNFHESTNVDEMWERFNLINLQCRKMKLGNLVKPAPSRLSLKMFGGHLDIAQFRDFGKCNKFINLNFPPMTSITQQLEEINDFELSNDLKYIPIDNERINKYKEKIVFRRTKPLIDTNKSLESAMNLKYE